MIFEQVKIPINLYHIPFASGGADFARFAA